MSDSLPMTVTTLTRAQKRQVLNLVRRAARAEILPRFRDLAPGDIATKTGPQDLVTEADRAAEAMITRGLQQMFPHALIVGEEAVSDHPDIEKGLPDAELAFTVDPVDGTWNYANGIATFGVIVAVARYGVPVFGLHYDPVMDDCIWADSDGAAEFVKGRRAPRKVQVSEGGAIEDISGFVGLKLLPDDKQDAMAATFPKLRRALNLRCACHEYRVFAQGGVDFVLASKLTPWDHTAASLIAARAGGHVAMLDGSEYRAGMRDGYLLAASNQKTWMALRDLWSFLVE
ncbi:Inositol-1-monophosphatase [Roseivivax sp. THAF40]|uniref:inositol monophosphatase family protein n=1 Tax=unclassified Roseivivax TaxID=2639302 RepID=UPI00126843B3|nr:MULTISPECIES: inositol monophosphatase [unclassified Roseivivax]QFS82089.1 Inositol-1-monophosphatase [Roseivivax sp. THAF197b]QFT45889.1 Inositol-1-monophosphatase [Roseivivax sp. THAF40]